MGDTETVLPPSKKRAAGREISKDNPGDDDDNTSELETGTFQKASNEVLATRRIVKVRRHPSPAVPSSNPFAGICLIPTEAPKVTEKPASEVVDRNTEDNTGTEKCVAVIKSNEKDTNVEDETDDSTAESGPAAESAASEEKTDPVGTDGKEAASNEELLKEDNGDKSTDTPAATPFSSFQQLSSNQNAFTGITGTGFSSSSFSFGSIPKDGSAFGVGSVFGNSIQKPSSLSSFGFGNSNNGTSSLFGTPGSGSSNVSKSESNNSPSMQEVPLETGEENEKPVFAADAVLFEYLDGGWKERGKGELKVNVSTSGVEKPRLVMRARGIYRLILNASLYPDMKFANMDKRGITFACVNSIGEGKGGLSTFALKFKDGSIKEGFCTAVTTHKGKSNVEVTEGNAAAVLKTPENSP
ncbi:hypothetical protein GIB67_035442 [Kingdonia uniflora]|uniref:RanBD1 domain-containing protein n=1 Tax=Kingdonia uniflora TaxID=39325 RepID=A0A7J7P133_9MAGN|nr:hypothetical protein GIB67_035442 [Kingdonia uniflora]